MMDYPFNNSYMPKETRTSTENGNPFPNFVSLLASLPPPDTNMNSGPRLSPFHPNRTMDTNTDWNQTERMCNCSHLPCMVKFMRNFTDAPMCFLRAFVAPLSWRALTSNGSGHNLNPEEYEGMVWAAKPLLQTMPPVSLGLPPNVQIPHLANMMKMLQEVFGSLSEAQRDEISEWLKEQVAQNYYNCSVITGKDRPKPEQSSPPAAMPRGCPSKLVWLRMEVMKMMGPFLTRLPLSDISSIPKDELCPFFHTPQFGSSFQDGGRVNPTMGRTILDRVKECSLDKQDFAKNVDRLGSLACFYDDAPPLNSSLSMLLLSQLKNCSNMGVNLLKKRLVDTVMSSTTNASSPELLRSLGSGATELSPKQLSMFPVTAIKDTLLSLGPDVMWRLSQAKELAQKVLQGTQTVSGKELMSLGSAVGGVASSLLRKVKDQGLLGNAALRDMSEKMTRVQRKALLEGLLGNTNASELVDKIPDALRSSLSLATLEQAGLTSLDQLMGKKWNMAQSAFLVRKLLSNDSKLQDLRKLGSAIKGMACQRIDQIAENNVKEMAQILTQTPTWLPKAQVCCAARRLFANLEKERLDYFRNVTEKELNDIPTLLLLHLPHMKMMDLPDSVCPALLDKMKSANLSCLPLGSPCRAAVTNRTLRCLLNGTSMSELPTEKVLSLGPLLCELPTSQLALMAPEALNSSLQALSSCSQIPPQNRMSLLKLLNSTYGDPSDWSAETMRSLGPLLLLDDSAVRFLRYKSWLKNTLCDLRDSMPQPPVPLPPKEFRTGVDLSALKQKLFSLSLMPPPSSSVPPMRKKRQVAVSQEQQLPTAPLIQELGKSNVYWTPVQLAAMSDETFSATVETLGAVPDYSAEQLSVLKDKAIKAWGPVAKMNESHIFHMGCVCQGFNTTELSSLPISSLDSLETLTPCRWTQPQRVAVWQGFSNRTGVTGKDLGAVDMLALNQFICGLSSKDVGQLNAVAFREAVDSLGTMQCPLVVTESLNARAVAVFGAAASWTDAVVNTLGNIMAGLSVSELRSLSPSVFSFMSQTSIPLIPAERLAVLSVNQLTALGPDNAAMVTVDQRAVLQVEQLKAVDNALGVPSSRAELPTQQSLPPVSLNQPQKSGASTPGKLGIEMVYLQPLMLFLLVLFL
ncbi:otoancorin [Aplochiton taeniatus]